MKIKITSRDVHQLKNGVVTPNLEAWIRNYPGSTESTLRHFGVNIKVVWHQDQFLGASRSNWRYPDSCPSYYSWNRNTLLLEIKSSKKNSIIQVIFDEYDRGDELSFIADMEGWDDPDSPNFRG